jgi:hypothetical protein
LQTIHLVPSTIYQIQSFCDFTNDLMSYLRKNYESYERSHVMMKKNSYVKTPIMLNMLRIKQINFDKVFN